MRLLPRPHDCTFGLSNLRVWRVQKCIPLVGAVTSLICAGLQTTSSQVSQNRLRTEICGNPGLHLAMVPCLHQSNVYIKRKLWIRRVQKCIPVVGAKPSPTYARLETTPFHISQYRAEHENFMKSVSTFCHSIVFAPKKWLHQQEATCMETSKMYSSRRCKNLT